ncbi:MAG: hypothetical protein RBG13Loki_1358 [Promethearchaeota archaeon CR_4]|nr:MAG: hypothetical protein RBG13Loki_1358 [Candidatus Lokiarchaeota archaeon CR_4]
MSKPVRQNPKNEQQGAETNHKGRKKPADDGSDESEDQFYIALSHDIRRHIIKIIGRSSKSSFTEFKQSLKVSTGTLYHHLEVLKECVYQKSDKKYYLTKLGEHAYHILEHNVESIEASKEKKVPETENKPSFLKNLFKIWPRIYISITQKEGRTAAVLLIALLVVGGLLCAVFDVETTLIFFNWLKPEEVIPLEEKIWMFFRYILSMGGFIAICEIICRIVLRKKDNLVPFILSFFIILLPTIFYLVVHSFLFVIAYEVVSENVDRIIMVIFQIWTVWNLTYTISILKFVPVERGFIASFISYYIGFMVLIITLFETGNII